MYRDIVAVPRDIVAVYLYLGAISLETDAVARSDVILLLEDGAIAVHIVAVDR